MHTISIIFETNKTDMPTYDCVNICKGKRNNISFVKSDKIAIISVMEETNKQRHVIANFLYHINTNVII